MLISLIVFLVIAGFAVWLIGLLPIDPTIAKVIRGVILFALILAVLDSLFGLGWGFGTLTLRRR